MEPLPPTEIIETELTPEMISKMVKSPMAPLIYAGEIVYDDTMMALSCPRRHIHKYFLKDIVDTDGKIKCETCDGTSKEAIFIRETAESLLKIPFILSDKCFKNISARISLITYRYSGKNSYEKTESGLIIYLYKTISELRIIRTILEALESTDDDSLRQMAERARIALEAGDGSFKSKNIKKAFSRPKKKFFTKDNLPYTPEMAEIKESQTKSRPGMIISDDILCLENSIFSTKNAAFG